MTPTKPTIDSLIEDFVSEHTNGYYVKGKLTESFKQSLLKLVLDEVIIKDLPHVMGKCNKKWCYCSAYAINATLKHLKQRARELLK